MRKFEFELPGIYACVAISRESPAARQAKIEAEFKERNVYFYGDYATWADAKAGAIGYDSPHILATAVASMRQIKARTKKYERDTVLLDKAQLSYPLLTALLYTASLENGRLHVMDFGGALGSTYYQHCKFFTHLPDFKWGVIEQTNFVEAGINEFSTDSLSFFYSPDECDVQLEANFLLLSSVLQYLEEPYALLERLLGKNIPYVLVDRAMAQRLGTDRLVIQKVPASIYDASYPAWMMDANRMEQCFEKHDYEIVEVFDPHPDSSFGPKDFRSAYVGWFLKKRRHVPAMGNSHTAEKYPA